MVTVNPGLRSETPRAETLMASKRSPKRGAQSFHRFSYKRAFTAKLLFERLWRVKFDIRIALEKVVLNR
jgi:hypothetical protein